MATEDRRSGVEAKVVAAVNTVTGLSCVAFVEETDSVPFCCYEVTDEVPVYTKAGTAGWRSSVSIYIVDDSESDVDTYEREVMGALENAADGSFLPRVRTRYGHEFDSGQWVAKIDYTILTV